MVQRIGETSRRRKATFPLQQDTDEHTVCRAFCTDACAATKDGIKFDTYLLNPIQFVFRSTNTTRKQQDFNNSKYIYSSLFLSKR